MGKDWGKVSRVDVMLGVYYKPPNYEQTGKATYKQLGEVSHSPIFNLPDVCWKYNTAERKKFRRFQECMELVKEATRGGALPDLQFVNGLVLAVVE
ncbi:hypothetical protein BTVI_39236 [Pitangus sulphuratus]|nr:hypothetical protein BTVI_39236 [Pitangus sulphuratus]